MRCQQHQYQNHLTSIISTSIISPSINSTRLIRIISTRIINIRIINTRIIISILPVESPETQTPPRCRATKLINYDCLPDGLFLSLLRYLSRSFSYYIHPSINPFGHQNLPTYAPTHTQPSKPTHRFGIDEDSRR